MTEPIHIHGLHLDLDRALKAWHASPVPLFDLWQAVVVAAEKLKMAKTRAAEMSL